MGFLLFLSKYTNLISKAFVSIGLIIVSSSLLIQVILRFVFRTGLPWVGELTRYGIIWITMMEAPILIKNNELIKVDFFDEFWSPKTKKYRNLLYRVFTIFIFMIMIKEGWLQALAGLKARTVSLGVTWFWPYLSIPIGFSLMSLELTILVLKDLKSLLYLTKKKGDNQ